MFYNRNIGPWRLALLSFTVWSCASSVTLAQTATGSTSQVGGAVSNGPVASSAIFQAATNTIQRGHSGDVSDVAPAVVPQTNAVVDSRKWDALWHLPADELKKKAVVGDADAQTQLGNRYLGGDDVPQNYTEAVKWYRKAADQGEPLAQLNLGRCYYDGKGVPQDYAVAARWYRKAAEQGMAVAQSDLADCYDDGRGVQQDDAAAVKWYRKAAEKGLGEAQLALGLRYYFGQGVSQDYTEAVKWYRKAAEQGYSGAQSLLGDCYHSGRGVPRDYVEAVKWCRKAAEQGDALAQGLLGYCYEAGQGVPQDYIEAYKWYNLSAAQKSLNIVATGNRDRLVQVMTPEQIAEGQRRASQYVARHGEAAAADQGSQPGVPVTPKGNGTGFFVASGYVLTSYHVVKDSDAINILSGGGRRRAKIVKVDPANDLALLRTAEDIFDRLARERAAKAGGTVTNVSAARGNPYDDIPITRPERASESVTNVSAALPILSSRGVHLGASVFTLGFPNTEVQGVEPKLTRGEINSLSGIQDDVRFFQMSAPVQPGNSGGPLVDARGNVIGIVEARLDDLVALETSGALPQNVNYALKSSFLIAFLDSEPELAGKLKAPHTETDRPFNDVVKEVQKATVMVIVY